MRLSAVVFVLAMPLIVQAQEVQREVSAERCERILRDLGLDFKHSAGKNGVVQYTFTRNNYKTTLTSYNGKDLMLSTKFSAMPLETVNAWNQAARFSRAVLYGDGNDGHSALESNLDCLGGVTEQTVKHFVNSFDDEIRRFDEFLLKISTANEVYTSLSGDRLERLLAEMKVAFKKSEAKAKGTFLYDFKKGDFDIRLTNFGGQDLMLDVMFPDAALAKINKYNLERKFVRVVRYRTANGAHYVSLEANLDCAGGVTDNIVRWYLQRFDDEVLAFSKYLTRS